MADQRLQAVGKVILAGIMLGIVTMLVCVAWQDNHEQDEDDRMLAAGYQSFEQSINDVKTGQSTESPPFERRSAPLPARSPVLTGIVVAVAVVVVGLMLTARGPLRDHA